MRILIFVAALALVLVSASPATATSAETPAEPVSDATLPLLDNPCGAPVSVDRPVLTADDVQKGAAGRSWTQFPKGTENGATSACSCSGTCGFFFDCDCTSCSLSCGLFECHFCCEQGCRENCSPF